MFWLCLLLSWREGSQLGNAKINVEYFDQSGMKQELPKVWPSVSPQHT